MGGVKAASNINLLNEGFEMEKGHKDAKSIRMHYKEKGEGSTLGPACHGCGRMQNESNPPVYRGFCSEHDDPDGQSVICPDCGTEYWGYYIWTDTDGTKAVLPFNNPDDKTVKCEPDEFWPSE